MARRYNALVLVGVLIAATRTLAADDKLPPQGQVAKVNGVEMYYEVHGKKDGEPLLLLHGFFGSCKNWMSGGLFDGLVKEYRLILPDMRGHGRSTNPDGKFTHRQAALDAFALLETLETKEFRAIGSSSGGMVLLHMATQQPERVKAMVLVSTTHYFPQEVRDGMASMDAQRIDKQFMARMRVQHKCGDAQIRSLVQQFHDFKNSYDDMNFTPPYLSTIKASTLIIHGDRDEGFPVKIPVEMYRSIPNAYLWIVPNGDHFFMARNPDAFPETILAFLRGDWEKRESRR